ncbi:MULTISPECIES: zinc-dependent alcohol dehydrogenase family protein [Sphingobium]|uniref:zinc-dependent alcohol dehydrogenase family protein n=1 Tax=Sphingobium sp. MI1205 TaxID=407020 RepID=UPI000770431D|nr:NAD(P)-dependent alcohol dehydrogenase [Sphingobium sp. MI1205]AMK19584.1 Zinc-containing alcohol dehydrogenase [Sphingobium sp. MI1205]
MRAIIIDPDNENRYCLVDRPQPEPGPGEVRLSMRAASLNFRDLIVRNHPVGPFFGDARGRIALSDGVGVVNAVGAGVDPALMGQRVVPSFFPDWLEGKPTAKTVGRNLGGSIDGVLAETIVIPAQSVVPVPQHLSDVEAATLPCAGVTAWAALVLYGQARAGQTILVQGTGGVSIFALQIAKILGLHAILISSSDEKLDRAKAMGADALINYKRTPDWSSTVREITGGLGVDHLIEVAGEATMLQSLQSMALGGNISLVGVLTGFGGQLDGMALRGRTLHLHTVEVESVATLQQFVQFVTDHELRPVVDRSYDIADANMALDALATGSHFGKIALTIAPQSDAVTDG